MATPDRVGPPDASLSSRFRVRRQWLRNGAVTAVQIERVLEETHAVLRQRAARAHQSLQEYLLGLLVREAGAPTLDEVLERVSGRSAGTLSFSEATQAIRDDRDRR